MKRLAIILPLALLAACEARDDAAAPDATATETMPVDAAATPAAGPTPGSYDVTGPDGTKTVDTLMADGTYVSRDANDKVLEKGTWAVKDGKTCFDAEGDEAEVCYTEGARNADGSFDATGPDGKVAKVTPRAS
jgi:hypothetical protein